MESIKLILQLSKSKWEISQICLKVVSSGKKSLKTFKVDTIWVKTLQKCLRNIQLYLKSTIIIWKFFTPSQRLLKHSNLISIGFRWLKTWQNNLAIMQLFWKVPLWYENWQVDPQDKIRDSQTPSGTLRHPQGLSDTSRDSQRLSTVLHYTQLSNSWSPLTT